MQIHTTPDGDKYFTEIPEGFKVATLDDFYNEGRLIINKAFLVQSEHTPERYYARRTTLDFPYHGSDFPLFLKRNEIFTLK